MKILNFTTDKINLNKQLHIGSVFIILLLLWPFAQRMLSSIDANIGYVDPSIWLLVLLANISYLAVLFLAWWVLKKFWAGLGLPALSIMVSQFKQLQVWQQLGFYYASFALLLLAGIGALIAVL